MGLLDLLDHLFFLLFCARFSRGTKRASGACSQVPRAAFLWGSQETLLFDLFLGGTANPEGVRQRTDKAEARRAASAQAAFPSRRAREKSVPEKDNGMRRIHARQEEIAVANGRGDNWGYGARQQKFTCCNGIRDRVDFERCPLMTGIRSRIFESFPSFRESCCYWVLYSWDSVQLTVSPLITRL